MLSMLNSAVLIVLSMPLSEDPQYHVSHHFGMPSCQYQVGEQDKIQDATVSCIVMSTLCIYDDIQDVPKNTSQIHMKILDHYGSGWTILDCLDRLGHFGLFGLFWTILDRLVSNKKNGPNSLNGLLQSKLVQVQMLQTIHDCPQVQHGQNGPNWFKVSKMAHNSLRCPK